MIRKQSRGNKIIVFDCLLIYKVSHPSKVYVSNKMSVMSKSNFSVALDIR